MQAADATTITEVPFLPPRPPDANKGTFGRVLVVAGSKGMSGAAILCASAALRGGAGLVFLAVPESVWSVVAGANPCYLTIPLPEGNPREQILQKQMESATVAVIGPGLGQGPDTEALVHRLPASPPIPLVLDADALNIWSATQGSARAALDEMGKNRPLVLTPHPGEFARLTGLSIPHIQAHREELAVQFARAHHLTLVLKGAGTVVSDGSRLYINTTGNPGMATGGTGDVLAGLLGALLAQGMEPFSAAVLGTYLHGLAGDLGRDRLGEVSLLASDLLDELSAAFRRHKAGG